MGHVLLVCLFYGWGNWGPAWWACPDSHRCPGFKLQQSDSRADILKYTTLKKDKSSNENIFFKKFTQGHTAAEIRQITILKANS